MFLDVFDVWIPDTLSRHSPWLTEGLPAQPPGTSLVYRAAFSFVCRQVETLMSGALALL